MDYETELCTQLKKTVNSGGGNITIFSVIFDVDDEDYPDTTSQNISEDERKGGVWIKDVFKACTSNPEQFFFDVDVQKNNYTESDIERVYTTIAQYFYKTRIVE
jgi:hypothetical protein